MNVQPRIEAQRKNRNPSNALVEKGGVGCENDFRTDDVTPRGVVQGRNDSNVGVSDNCYDAESETRDAEEFLHPDRHVSIDLIHHPFNQQTCSRRCSFGTEHAMVELILPNLRDLSISSGMYSGAMSPMWPSMLSIAKCVSV